MPPAHTALWASEKRPRPFAWTQPGLPRACKGRAQTVRARYLVGGREQVWQAGTREKAPVQRRGPQAVRGEAENRSTKHQRETEDDVAGMLRSRRKRGPIQTIPFYSPLPLGRQHPAMPSSAHQGGLWRACPKEGWWWRGQGRPALTPLPLTSSGLDGCVC